MFHYTDGEPRTPEPPGTGLIELPQPPEPPRQAYRLRRRRDTRQMARDYFNSSDSADIPVPTIEVSDPPAGMSVSGRAYSSARDTGFRSLRNPRRRASPPKTPGAQIFDASRIDREASPPRADNADTKSQAESISRPSTACSCFSDSSVSSSLESFPSLGESFTSPEAEAFDHKVIGDDAHQPNEITSPPGGYGHASAESVEPRTRPNWTEEMDSHLWMTYMRYLQDPTHTPFKMLPGTAPPLGVCSRIVREAKRTWKGPRISGSARAYKFIPWGFNGRSGSPDTIKPTTSGDCTPTELSVAKAHPAWPRSDSATRRRLRELCRRKPTLSAHYNRLLNTRSPSPFLTSTTLRSSSAMQDVPMFSPVPPEASFSTRDMNISLVTSTSAVMQPGSALNQLGNADQTPQIPSIELHAPPSGRFNAHQKSQSLQLNLGLGSSSSDMNGHMLASPFQPTSSKRESLVCGGTPIENQMQVEPRLASPLQLGPSALGESLKRRNEDDPMAGLGSSSSLFPEEAQRPADFRIRRVRARGFSLGDVSESSRFLSSLFSPPSQTETASSSNGLPPQNANSLLPPPAIGRPARLGSPFSEKPSRPFNTFPRNFSLQSLEPTIEERQGKFDEPAFPHEL
jgi:hypothetical protein